MQSEAQGRLKNRKPVAIIDIGSNSVRLVIYEGLVRALTPMFNEKVMAGLGKGLVKSGKLQEKSVERALAALSRFVALSHQAGVETIHVIATAAAREAENGEAFIARAEEIVGVPVRVLSGREEAYFSALGVVSSFHGADGIVGDLGGGSLELVDVNGAAIGEGITLPVGGLRLADLSGESLADAAKFVRSELRKADILSAGQGRTFYAVGGTWRNLAVLEMAAANYPLRIMHDYRLPADAVQAYLRRIIKSGFENLDGYQEIGKSRRALLPYGAVVLSEVIARMKPAQVATSAFGVREGYLYSLLDASVQAQDPLLAAAEEMAILRARSPAHSRELVGLTGDAFAAFGIDETAAERRYRHAACLLADIVWRAHPEYRAMQAVSLLANAAFVGIDHPGRAFIALANAYRHMRRVTDPVAPELLGLIDERMLHRVRLIGLVMRVGYLVSASMPGMLPKIAWAVDPETGGYTISLPADAADFAGEALDSRISALAKYLDKPISLAFR